MTTTTPLSTVIGVFADYDQADKAIDELRHTSFSYDRIRVVKKGTGGFLDTLRGAFTGQASTASSTAENLVKMGMPEYDAQHYQEELNANHVLILMNADDRPEEAFNIMRQNGAFDISSRLRTAPVNGSVEMDTPNGSRVERNPNMPPTQAATNAPTDTRMPPAANYPEEMPNGRSSNMPGAGAPGADGPQDEIPSDTPTNTYDPNARDKVSSDAPADTYDPNARAEMPRNA